MRPATFLSTSVATSLLLLVSDFASAQSSSASVQAGGPNAPLTTNNAQTNVCVQFGGCTTEQGGSLVTVSQATPVTAPAASLNSVPIPTDSAQYSAYLASLASAGAAAAFSSRMPSGSAPANGDGATSMPGSSASAGNAPVSIASASQQSRQNGAVGANGPSAWKIWTGVPAVAMIAAAGGAAFVL